MSRNQHEGMTLRDSVDMQNTHTFLNFPLSWKLWAGNYVTSPFVVSRGVSALAANTLYALPFPVQRSATFTAARFICNAVGGAGALGRIGIYGSISDTNIYPDALILDIGAADISAVGGPGIKNFVINQTLLPDWYWLAYISNDAVATIFYPSQTICGWSGDFGGSASNGISVAQAYGALPANFPGGGGGSNLTALIGMYLSTYN